MNITRMPATSTHTELMATDAGNTPSTASCRSDPAASADAGMANVASNPATTPVAQRVLRIDPPLSNSIAREHRASASADHCPRVEDSPAAFLPAVEKVA